MYNKERKLRDKKYPKKKIKEQIAIALKSTTRME